MTTLKPISVLFVCMGNICRSPMAEAVFRHMVGEAGLTERISIDSAGTGAWHAGEPPHRGTLDVLRKNGVDAGDQRARQLAADDFRRFDYIAAMDDENLAAMRRFPPEARARVRLLLDYAPGLAAREVPDPFYSGGFDEVYALVTAGCRGLLEAIRRDQGL
ncbi:low molecular weight phosphotyrosine protein phosphatase [Oscillochloris sp. ZM17-4]|uniref:low molecular weight protein-tyrosine-phosphatase n=1 Tax=Oscillochloris sp. ZM17-4 TaxID=2866714 RepID=UPI001C73DB75|nr:low molecular weight protein-tyrosine-phosphatase [Oscillochloris sp. ZM17-4]MBX0330635.1 low molecular weight phosphotyrosine protein phosphatase [Oscillochloris sp. ZM17-4]